MTPKGRTAVLLAALALSGCATEQRFGTLEARYQNPDLPLDFRAGENGCSFALYGFGNNQETVRYQGEYRERATPDQSFLLPGDTIYPYAKIEERFRFRRDAALLGATLLWEAGDIYSGFTGGTDPAHAEDFHIGGFVGTSQAMGPFVLSVSGGLFRNKQEIHARYWANYNHETIDSNGFNSTPIAIFRRDSADMQDVDYEIRGAAGLMLRLQPDLAAPFITAEGGWVRFWAPPRDAVDNRILADYAWGGGVEVRLFPHLPVRWEIKYGTCSLAGGISEHYLATGLRAAREW